MRMLAGRGSSFYRKFWYLDAFVLLSNIIGWYNRKEDNMFMHSIYIIYYLRDADMEKSYFLPQLYKLLRPKYVLDDVIIMNKSLQMI